MLINKSDVIDLNASDVIHDNSVQYKEYIIKETFPHVIDGLKQVARIIIWSNRKNKSYINGLSFVAQTSSMHHRGDNSIYKSIVRLAQPFSVTYPLVDINGNFGNYAGNPPGASKYITCKLSDFCKDVYLNDLNENILSMRVNENLTDQEPKYLIPKIPMALILNNLCIGYGYKSTTIPYDLAKICDMIEFYIENKYDNFSKYKDYLVPTFPVENHLINLDELKFAYENNVHDTPIRLEGKVQVLNKYSILIRTLPFYILPKNVFNKILINLRNTDYLTDFIDSSQDNNHCDIYLSFKRNMNIFDIIFKLKKFINLEHVIYPVFNFVLDNKMIKLNQLNILQLWYKERYKYLELKLANDITKLKKRINEIEIYLKVIQDLDIIINIIKNNTFKDGSKLLMKKYDLSLNQVDILYSTSLSVLSKTSKDELLDKLKIYQNKLKHIKETNLDKNIINDAKRIKDKYYRKKYVSKKPVYIGYAYFDDNNLYQLEDLDELEHLATKIKHKNMRIFTYKYLDSKKRLINGNRYKLNTVYVFNKFEKGQKIIEDLDNYKYTIVLKDNYIYYCKGLRYTESGRCFYVNKEFYTIDSYGNIKLENISNLPLRNDINKAKGNMTDIIYIISESQEKYIVSFNDISPKIIKIEKWNKNKNKLILKPNRRTIILDDIDKYSDVNDHVINIPYNYRDICKCRGILLKNLNDIKIKKQFKNITINSKLKIK